MKLLTAFGLTTLVILSGPLLGGCSSVQSRIEDNPDKFVALSPEEQARVQSGHIEPGYTKDMVFLSKGEPSSRSEHKERGNLIEVWTYNRPVAAPVSGVNPPTGFSGAYSYPQFGPGPQNPTPMYYGGSPMRVEFENGRVRKLMGQQ